MPNLIYYKSLSRVFWILIFTFVATVGVSVAQGYKNDVSVARFVNDNKDHQTQSNVTSHRLSNSAGVNVSYDIDSKVVIDRKRNMSNRASGMRVCIYFDNGQQARAGADQALSLLREMYPNLRGEVVYQNPFFKVMAGNCLDRIEAARLLGVLRTTFPGAIIVNETMPLDNFIISESENGQSLLEDPLSRPVNTSDSVAVDTAIIR